MKLAAFFLLATASSLTAQTASSAKPSAHPAARTGAAAHATAVPASAQGGGCVKVPEISPKIPALPADLPCPHALYTISTVPSIRLDYISPIENSSLRDSLGIEPTTFSLAYVDTKVAPARSPRRASGTPSTTRAT